MSLQPWFQISTEKTEQEKQDDAFIDSFYEDNEQDDSEDNGPTRNVGTLPP